MDIRLRKLRFEDAEQYRQLQLEAGNSRAKELYESFGFQVWGTEPKAVRVDGVYYDDYHMIFTSLGGEEI